MIDFSKFGIKKSSLSRKPFKFKPASHKQGMSGASISMQRQWTSFSMPKKMVMRSMFRDFDRDGVPDKWDCQPRNPYKDAQIFISKGKRPELRKGLSDAEKESATRVYDAEEQGNGAFAFPTAYPNAIIFGNKMKDIDFEKPENIKYLSNVIGHEETHLALNKINRKGLNKLALTPETKEFDNITIPTVRRNPNTDPNAENEILNPYSALEIEPSVNKRMSFESYESDKPTIEEFENKYKQQSKTFEDEDSEDGNQPPD